MVHIGIDLGGTNIKAGLTSPEGVLLVKDSIKTGGAENRRALVSAIGRMVQDLMSHAGISQEQVASIGAGFPGFVDRKVRRFLYAPNLPLMENVILSDLFPDFPKDRLFVENDANAAALGELYGMREGSRPASLVILTLGTGVGCGIVIHGQIYTGFNGGAGEAGHMVIYPDGRPCNCGRSGCFEQYASARGLVQTTYEEMETDKNSALWALDHIGGRSAFDAARGGDAAGKRAVKRYIKDLALGITNVVSLLQPEILALAGGVSGEGDAILLPLMHIYEKERFNTGGRFTRLAMASCKDAGIIGAAMLHTQQGFNETLRGSP